MTAAAAGCFPVAAATPEAVALTLSAVTAAVALEVPPRSTLPCRNSNIGWSGARGRWRGAAAAV
jgi:hypothetical protein